MPLESSDARLSTAASVNSVADVACDASAASEQFGGMGWIEFDKMASKLAWRHSRLTAVLRWLRKQSLDYVVESKVSSGVVKVRITKVESEAKQAKQLSVEIISQLAKLYSNLMHSDRNRKKLACDVRTIASQIAPFLENREFHIQCKRYKRQLADKQPETPMEESAEIPASRICADQADTASISPANLVEPRGRGFDQRALRRLVLISSIIVVGLLVTIVLTTTFLHAMEQLSQYVERINSQLEPYR